MAAVRPAPVPPLPLQPRAGHQVLWHHRQGTPQSRAEDPFVFGFARILSIKSTDEVPDPVIFGPLDPDPVLFSTDPDPTCNNGFIKLFLSWTKYISESTNSSIKWWVIISNFIRTYLKYKYIFFFISISGRIRSRIRSRIRIFFLGWAGSGSGSVEKKIRILIPGTNLYILLANRTSVEPFMTLLKTEIQKSKNI